jgi:hypothetical protein
MPTPLPLALQITFEVLEKLAVTLVVLRAVKVTLGTIDSVVVPVQHSTIKPAVLTRLSGVRLIVKEGTALADAAFALDPPHG